jgi:hypothetical protein
MPCGVAAIGSWAVRLDERRDPGDKYGRANENPSHGRQFVGDGGWTGRKCGHESGHEKRSAPKYGALSNGRYWARTSDLRLVEAALSQLS